MPPETTRFAPAQDLPKTLSQWMARGGDARIGLDPDSGTNRYYSAPYPRGVLALASSTANDLSADAMDHLCARFPQGAEFLQDGAAYGALLDELRGEIRAAYDLDGDTDVFFAPSGTDLEYVPLIAFAGQRGNGIANFLLGADEVGSGCIYSAAGQYFAKETALDAAVSPGQAVEGLPSIILGDLPLRSGEGEAHESDWLSEAMELTVAEALALDRFPLVHVVHGSKTGLVLPSLEHVDRLRARFRDNIAFVVDACQARITAEAIRAYLDRGIIVFLTGSKFMGGPPFSGFALLPKGLAAAAPALPKGVGQIFRRAEIPASWHGREICEDSGSPGLALRLAASLFELRRFQALGADRIAGIVGEFTAATDRLAAQLGLRKVASAPAKHIAETADHPVEMLTLVTLDLRSRRGGLSFDDAVTIHRQLVDREIRLGQPARCLRLNDGNWGGTLRVGISMPQMVMLAGLDAAGRERWFDQAMGRIAEALTEILED